MDDDCEPPTTGQETDPFCTIEEGISAASDYDTVWVLPGTYVIGGILDFYGKIKLRGTDPEDQPTINGEVYISRQQGPETLLEGFTITNPQGYGDGCGVRCMGTDPEIRGNTITGNANRGIYLYNSDSLVIDNIVSGNQGGGILITGDTSVKLVDCLIEGNTASPGNGGGVYVEAEGTIWMVNCTVQNNTASGVGGGVFMYGALDRAGRGLLDPCDEEVFKVTVNMQNCLVTCNTASQGGGGLYVSDCAKADVVNTTMTQNEGQGGTIYALSSCVTVSNSILWGDNSQTEIYAGNNSDLTISYSVLEGGCDGIDDHTDRPITCDDGSVFSEDPLFVDPLDEELPCSGDEDFRITADSPAVDSGNNTLVLLDEVDLDEDEDTDERTPLDLDRKDRFVDEPDASNSGEDDQPDYPYIVDMGAYEVQLAPVDPPVTPDGEPGYDKIRYISFEPDNPGIQTALRVTLTTMPPPFAGFSGQKMWVGAPATKCEHAGVIDPPCPPVPGLPPSFQSARLQCTPNFADYGSVGALHVADDEIVPLGVYDVQAIAYGCMPGVEANYSDPLTINTSKWGDLISNCTVTPCGPPDGIVQMADVTAVLDKYKNLAFAVMKSRADLDWNVPNWLINISDVTFCLDAFLGATYPPAGWAGPGGCP